jgi:hypothetical protein
MNAKTAPVYLTSIGNFKKARSNNTVAAIPAKMLRNVGAGGSPSNIVTSTFTFELYKLNYTQI